jgi:PhzF family phenazine biosynthesis protein
MSSAISVVLGSRSGREWRRHETYPVSGDFHRTAGSRVSLFEETLSSLANPSPTTLVMRIPIFQVDAFAQRPFEGNPAAVCPLDAWPADSLLQAIAEENNLSETAFFVPERDGYALRWFTPAEEVDLCGHATLAAAHVLFTHLRHAAAEIHFHTRSGMLTVRCAGSLLHMDFPAAPPSPAEASPALVEGLGLPPREVLAAFDHIAVYGSEEEVRALTPDFARLRNAGLRGVVATAPGTEPDVDFVSRCFFPRLGVDEDPVTGSAHCELAPFWSDRLGRPRLRARQLSRRGGTVECEVRGARVLLSGGAVDYLFGEIETGEDG